VYPSVTIIFSFFDADTTNCRVFEDRVISSTIYRKLLFGVLEFHFMARKENKIPLVLTTYLFLTTENI